MISRDHCGMKSASAGDGISKTGRTDMTGEEKKSSHDRMKYLLADAMKQCMKKAAVEKITVKEIVEECGTTRQTFYRNFRDKYDLINWYFDKILQESFEHMGGRAYDFRGACQQISIY